MTEIRVDPFPGDQALRPLMEAAWGVVPWNGSYTAVLPRSLVHVAAYEGDQVVGFINVAWDGAVHASIFDTAVHPDHQRKGLATRLVRQATGLARERGAQWLHVDYEPHLADFYAACGFRSTAAGVIRLAEQV